MSETECVKVLIADDESHIRMLMKRVIKKCGFDIAGEARDGQEAVDLFRKTLPDLLLLDINMPRKTGIEALEEIRSVYPNACVIMLTSVSDFDNVKKCIGLGAVNYLRKDTPLEEIEEMVKKTCEKLEKGKGLKENSGDKPDTDDKGGVND
jgi:two-component system, chemotaxis family, chemotaxis protein CheY